MRTVIRLVLVALAICSGLWAQPDPAALAQQGKQAMSEGRFSDAALAYGDLSKLIPKNPGLMLNHGMALHMAGRDAEAIASLESALALQPEMFPALLFLGASHLRLGRSEQALPPLEKAERIQPDAPQLRQLLGDAYTAVGRHRDAVRYRRKQVAAAPQDPAAHALLVQAYEALVTDTFDALKKTAPESASMLRLVGDLRLSQQQHPSALFLYREALDRDPAMRGLHAAVAEIYRRTGHADWAAQEDAAEDALPPLDCSQPSPECDYHAGRFEQAAAAKAAEPEQLYWRAKAYSALAAQAFQALEALPSSARKHEIVAELFAEQQRFADSAAEWKKALDLDAGNSAYRASYVAQLYLARDYAEAEPLLKSLLATAPTNPQWNFFLGDILLQRQAVEEALPLLEKAVGGDGSLLPARHALGRAYMMLEQPAKAIPQLKAALEIDQDGSLHYQLAQAYIRTGRREEAREPLAASQKLRQALAARQAASQEMAITAP